MKIKDPSVATPKRSAADSTQAESKPAALPAPRPAAPTLEAPAVSPKLQLVPPFATGTPVAHAATDRGEQLLGFNVTDAVTSTEGANNQTITVANFNQARSLMFITGQTLGLGAALMSLPKGSVVLDLGAGTGRAFGTVFSPDKYAAGERDFGESLEGWKKFAPLVSHLKFLGVTATDAKAMQVPIEDPEHRFHMFAGRFFADIPTDELLAEFGKKASVAYDMVGVFAYSSTPEKDLVKLHEMTEPGATTFIFWPDNTSAGKLALFQLPDGSVVELPEYVKKQFGDAFDVQVVDEYPGKVIKLITKDGPTPKPLPTELMHTDVGGTPPTRTFRVVDPKMTPEQRAANELTLWDAAGVDTLFSNMASSYIYKDGPFEMRDPKDPSRYIQMPPARAMALVEERIASTYGAFSKATIEAKDPFWYHKIFATMLTTGDLDRASEFFEANKRSIMGRSDLGTGLAGVADLLRGKTDTPAIQELARHIPPAATTLQDLSNAVAKAGSSVPVSLETMFSDLRTGDGYTVIDDVAPSAYWGVQLRNAHSTAPPGSDTEIESAFHAVDALKMAMLHSPTVMAWLKEHLGKVTLPS